MSEVIARVRFRRRWNNLYPKEVAVFPLATARNLVAQGYADAMAPPEGAIREGEQSPLPQRQPTPIVRK